MAAAAVMEWHRTMEWANPAALELLWFVPAVLALLLFSAKRRRRLLERFAVDKSMGTLLVRAPMGGFDWRPWLTALGLTLCVAALARPRFGDALEQVQQNGLDMFVALDVSRSMLAEDVAPNRLARAKLDIQDVLESLGGDRVGLIAFAGNASVRVPLTADFEFFRATLRELGPKDVPMGGTAIGDAIRKAVDAFEDSADRDRVLLLITDGEDQDSYPLEAAKAAAEKRIRIFTVGLGDSSAGARIPAGPEEDAQFLQFDGKEVWSKMDDKLLSQLASLTGGQYVPARTKAYDLGQLLEKSLAGLQRSDYQTETRKVRREQFQLFLASGLACLLLAGVSRDRRAPAS